MFLTVHTVAAVAISEPITSRIAGFIAGVVSHILLDFFPHGDKGLEKWIEKQPDQKMLRTLIVALVDIVFVFAFTLIAIHYLPVKNTEVAYWTAVGAILPDLIWGLHLITGKRSKILGKISETHHNIQGLWKDTLSLKAGLAIQVSLFVLLVFIQL